MSPNFDIVKYMSGLTGFLFDRAVLESIALERGISEVTEFSQLTQRDIDLVTADMLWRVYIGPNTTASSSRSHGSYTKADGAQVINEANKERIYNILMGLYRKWDDPKADEIAENVGTVSFLDF